jgi:hypothetical protein
LQRGATQSQGCADQCGQNRPGKAQLPHDQQIDRITFPGKRAKNGTGRQRHRTELERQNEKRGGQDRQPGDKNTRAHSPAAIGIAPCVIRAAMDSRLVAIRR